MLGISTYFKDLDYEYLKKARMLGAKYLFTSFHIPEENSNLLKKELPNFLKIVNNMGFTLIPDISPHTFEKFNLKPNDFNGLSKLDIKAIRLDYGIDDLNLIKSLEKDFEIIFNASTISNNYLDEMEKMNFNFDNIKFLHNFYPKQDTGINEKTFMDINKKFTNRNLEIMSFVVGDKLKRFPLYEGLPTLENHRSVNPYIATLDLVKNYNVNHVLVGDSKAKLQTLKLMSDFLYKGIISIPVLLDEDYTEYYGKEFSTRRDPSHSIVRIGTPRISGIEINNNNNRNKGAITIENKLSKRYSGEINIHKVDNIFNSRSNTIGYIHPEFIDIVNYLDNSKIKFIKL